MIIKNLSKLRNLVLPEAKEVLQHTYGDTRVRDL
jgi:hypothetical protein